MRMKKEKKTKEENRKAGTGEGQMVNRVWKRRKCGKKGNNGKKRKTKREMEEFHMKGGRKLGKKVKKMR